MPRRHNYLYQLNSAQQSVEKAYGMNRGMPERTSIALSTGCVRLLELTSTAPPLLLSMAVALDPRAVFRVPTVTLEFTAKPAVRWHHQHQLLDLMLQ